MTEEVMSARKKRLEQGLITKEEYEVGVDIAGPENNAALFVYLATDEAGNINGQVFRIVEGKISIFSEPRESRAIYSDRKIWTLEQLVELIPNTLLVGYRNPAPPELHK